MDWWWQEFKGARRVIIIVIGTINTRAAAKRVNFGDATTNLHGITIEDTTFRHQPYTCVHSTISSTPIAESINHNQPYIYIYTYTHTHILYHHAVRERNWVFRKQQLYYCALGVLCVYIALSLCRHKLTRVCVTTWAWMFY